MVLPGRYRAAIGASPATGGCSAAEAKPAELGRHPRQVAGEHLRGDDVVQLENIDIEMGIFIKSPQLGILPLDYGILWITMV